MAGLFGAIAAGLGGRKSIENSLDLFREIYGFGQSRTGETVNWKTALQVATVLGVCRVLAEGVAQVPWRVYRSADGRRLPAPEHPLYDLLYRRPNGWQTSFEFRETLILHLVLTGNAFVWKGRVGLARKLKSLEPIEPGLMRVTRLPDGSLTYSATGIDGTRRDFATADIWHLRGPSWNSWLGMDAVRHAREAIGLSMVLEHTHADMHRNGVQTSGSYSVEGPLTDEQHKQLTGWLREHAREERGAPLILDRGAKWMSSQMSGVDAQHLETRKYQVEEICRAFRVMPIMVGFSDKTATYASAEQMFLAHVVHTLMPWYERIEQSGDVNLLTGQDREAGYYNKFTPNALMRGAAKDRGDYYAKALGAGGTQAFMTQDEIRDLEELNPMGGKAAELSQGAMAQKAPAAES